MNETTNEKESWQEQFQSWLRPVGGVVVALVLGVMLLCMMAKTIKGNNPAAIPATVVKEDKPVVLVATNAPTIAEQGPTNAITVKIETHSQAPRVWALGVTLAAEVSALALVLLAAARITRDE